VLAWFLCAVALASPFREAERWEPGTLGALPAPWVVAVDPSEETVAVLDAGGRVTLADARTLAVRWQVPIARGSGPVVGDLAFGPGGLAVVAGPRDEALRVVVIDPLTGRLEPRGRTPDGAKLLELRWLDGGDLLTRTREPEVGNPIDGLHERRWGPKPSEREIAAWIPARRATARDAQRVFVDTTVRSLDRGGQLNIKVQYQVWDDPWEPRSARPLKACPEWSETIRVSDDGRVAYTMGQIRCVYDLDSGEVIAWETRQVPFWAALSPDGSRVVERHGKLGRRYGVVRDARTGEVQIELDDVEGAAFTPDDGLIVWGSYRLRTINLADGRARWSVPLDGDVESVHVAPDAGAIAVAERVQADEGPRVRVLGPDGKVRATVADVARVRGFSAGGRLLLLDVRRDHLGVLDLRAPSEPGASAHRAAVGALRVDDDGGVVSGDAEGRLRFARGADVRTWRMRGEIRDLLRVGEELLGLGVEPVSDEGPFVWRFARQPLATDRRSRDVTLAKDAANAWIVADGAEVLVFDRSGPSLRAAGRGRGRETPAYSGRDGALGPDPRRVVAVPERDRFIAPLDGEVADRAHAWSLTRRLPVATYALGIGSPALLAADGKRVVVLDGRGAGRVFDGTGAVDLALSGGGEPCCVAVGGGIVALATARGTLLVFDALDGDLVQSHDLRFSSEPSAIAVSPRGDFIAVGGDGGQIVLLRR
jgi:hypothetical protein